MERDVRPVYSRVLRVKDLSTSPVFIIKRWSPDMNRLPWSLGCKNPLKPETPSICYSVLVEGLPFLFLPMADIHG